MFKNITLFLLVILSVSCRNHDYIAMVNYDYDDINDNDDYDATQVDLNSYPDWSELTHSVAAEPNFDEVFPNNKVLRLDISISTSDWNKMQSDLSSNIGSRYSMGGITDLDFTPIWVPCTVSYDGKDWYEVGVRYKGNSSLSTTYSSGNSKLSMKLDFDQYEYLYPALTNQRFYGFKQLNLNNNYNDKSFMREKVVADLFRDFGMVAAHTSFCAVYINDDYYGLYTIVEEVDDSVIKTQYADGSGNCYKPEDNAAYFYSYSFNTSELNLKTNTQTPDYSDAQAMYDALHSDSRTSNVEQWKSDLESTFNVYGFMRWQAVNCSIQNWDSYGNMAHNYYLYNDPTTSKLNWIPWDHNEALQSATGNYTCYEPGKLSSVKSSYWPLIAYLIAIDDYKAAFDGYLDEFINGVFEPTTMQAIYQTHYNLIKQYAYDEVSGRSFLSSDSQFDSAVTTLMSHVTSRYSSIASYLE